MTEQEQLEICKKCEWKILYNSETNHCYMFHSVVYGCRQFRPFEGNK